MSGVGQNLQICMLQALYQIQGTCPQCITPKLSVVNYYVILIIKGTELLLGIHDVTAICQVLEQYFLSCIQTF